MIGRGVSPERRPPGAAWGIIALALAPLIIGAIALRQGWAIPAREIALGWALMVTMLAAGLASGIALASNRIAPLFIALGLMALVQGLTLAGFASVPEALGAALLPVLGLHLWLDRAGLVPPWWARLWTIAIIVTSACLLAIALLV